MSELDEPEVETGPEGAPYCFLNCPVLNRYRCSLLCRTICADSGWSDKRAAEVRSECGSWLKFQDMKLNLQEDK